MHIHKRDGELRSLTLFLGTGVIHVMISRQQDIFPWFENTVDLKIYQEFQSMKKTQAHGPRSVPAKEPTSLGKSPPATRREERVRER
jgi:hypothetical protein